MKIGIIYNSDSSEQSIKTIKQVLDDAGIKSFVITKSKIENVDCVIVLGGDRGVRNYFHQTFDVTLPVLGVSEGEEDGILAQVDLREFASYTSILKSQKYVVDKVPRLGVKIDGKSVYPVLNDVAVFSSKSAILMEHTLRVNGEEVWHDNSDGVIVSTPLGSSAYSMSAGGPILFQDSAVFEIISVNSIDVTRRPIIVSNSSSIELDDVSARHHCEVVLDGRDRYKVNKTVECTQFFPPANIIRLKSDSTAISALAKKVHLAKDLLSASSSKLSLKNLEYEGGLHQKKPARKNSYTRDHQIALSHYSKRHSRRRIHKKQDEVYSFQI